MSGLTEDFKDLVRQSKRLIEANKTAYVDEETLRMAGGIIRMYEEMEKQECPLGKPCLKHGYCHGAEAEELREGIENIIRSCAAATRPVREDLQYLLDRVDARDSLAYLEAKKKDDDDV